MELSAGLDVALGVAVGSNAAPFEESIRLAERLDASGVDFISVGDSAAETFSLLGAIAARTARIKLMSGIATWSRSPVTMAHAATTVHNLSDGRFRLGIGPMPRQWAQEWHGIEFDPVIARMREYLATVRACLDATADHPTDIDGTYFRSHGFRGHPVTPTRRVPMMLAATLPQMVRLAAEMTDSVMLNSIHPWEWLTGPGADDIGAGLERTGRERAHFEVGILRFCGIDDDRAAAYDSVRRSIAFYFGIPYLRTLLEPFGYQDELAAGEAALAAGDDEAQVAAVSDRMVDAIGIAGTPAEVRDKIAAYGKHVDWLQLAVAFNQPPDIAERQQTTLMEFLGGLREHPSPMTTPIEVDRGPQIQRGYVGALGRQVHYREIGRERGTGSPTVFLHQTASSSAMWERVMTNFPDGRRLIALDTPGFGASDPMPGQPTVADYARRLLDAVIDLGVTRASIVGHHTGAVLAGELAVIAPDLVDRLVLVGPVVIADDDEERQWMAFNQRWQIDARGDYVIDKVVPRLRLSVTRDDPDHMASELVAYLQASDRFTIAYDAIWRYRAADRLPLITAPTMCVAGTAEMAALQDWTAAAHRLIPHSRLELMGGATSEMAFEEPAAVGALIRDFLEAP